jgi:hypothetical protein
MGINGPEKQRSELRLKRIMEDIRRLQAGIYFLDSISRNCGIEGHLHIHIGPE